MSEIFTRKVHQGGKNLGINFVPFIAGAAAGAFSRTICCPFDVIKIISQVEPRKMTLDSYRGVNEVRLHTLIAMMLRKEGLISLWKGNVPGMLMNSSYSAIQFAMLPCALKVIDEVLPSVSTLDNGAPSGLSVFLASAVSATTATMISYPLDLLRTKLTIRFTAKNSYFLKGSLKTVITQTYALEGMRGFFSGLSFSIVYASLSTSIILFNFHKLNSYDKKDEADDSRLSHHKTLLYGCISGMASKIPLMPLDVVKKRLQTQGAQVRNDEISFRLSLYKRSALSTLYNIAKNEGFLALYKGSVVSIVKSSLYTSVNLWCYDFVSSRLRKAGLN